MDPIIQDLKNGIMSLNTSEAYQIKAQLVDIGFLQTINCT